MPDTTTTLTAEQIAALCAERDALAAKLEQVRELRDEAQIVAHDSETCEKLVTRLDRILDAKETP